MKTIVGNRSGYVLFIILISLVLPVTLGAQLGEEEELCGVIVELSGFEDGFLDCDTPFDEVNDVAPYEARINGQGIFDGTEITLALPETVTVSIGSDEARVPQTTLYRQEGDNYHAVHSIKMKV